MTWADRTQVQRVELYTVWSLHTLYWFLLVLVGVSLLAPLGSRGGYAGWLAAIAVLAVALLALGSFCLQHAITDYPAQTLPVLAYPMVGLCAALALVATRLPENARSGTLFIAATALSWGLGGFAGQRFHYVLVAACAAVAAIVTRELGSAAYLAAVAAFFVFTVQISLWLLDVVRQLERARDTESSLAVAEERLRFSHDVHDVLGRRLSVIAVQAELAGALAERGDPRAVDQARLVRTTAHEGLREAREIARGYRPIDLGQEVEGARALLRSAGIEARAEVSGVPEQAHEAAARTIREAVTNLLRHSRARSVTMTYTEGELVIRNDGAMPAAGAEGTGLRALAEHVRAAGGELVTERDGEEFVVRARFDATGRPR